MNHSMVPTVLLTSTRLVRTPFGMAQLQEKLHDMLNYTITLLTDHRESDTAGGHQIVLLFIPNFISFQLGAHSMSAD